MSGPVLVSALFLCLAVATPSLASKSDGTVRGRPCEFFVDPDEPDVGGISVGDPDSGTGGYRVGNEPARMFNGDPDGGGGGLSRSLWLWLRLLSTR